MRDHGALTIAQNEKSCVLFGMSKEDVKLEAAIKILHHEKISSQIFKL